MCTVDFGALEIHTKISTFSVKIIFVKASKSKKKNSYEEFHRLL